MVENYIFFFNFKNLTKYFNITTSTLVDFSVGFVEGAIQANFTTIPKKTGIETSLPTVIFDPVHQKTKHILIIAAGGAVSKTGPIICKVAGTLLKATPNLLV